MDGCQAWAGAWPAHKEGRVLWCEGWLHGWPANEDGQASGCSVKNGCAAGVRPAYNNGQVSGCGIRVSGFVPIFVRPSPSSSGCPHLHLAVPIFIQPSPSSSSRPHLHLAVPIFIRPSPSSSDRTTHIVWSVRLDPPDLTSLCLILFMHSCMFSFHNRMSLHVLFSSTFYLCLDPRSSILISVMYPCLSDSGSH